MDENPHLVYPFFFFFLDPAFVCFFAGFFGAGRDGGVRVVCPGAGAFTLQTVVPLCNAKDREWKNKLEQQHFAYLVLTTKSILWTSCPCLDNAQTGKMDQICGRVKIVIVFGKGLFFVCLFVFLSSQTSLVRWEPDLKTSPYHLPLFSLLLLPKQPDGCLFIIQDPQLINCVRDIREARSLAGTYYQICLWFVKTTR